MIYLSKKIIYLFLFQFFYGWIYGISINDGFPECEACLENPETCFNKTLTKSITIKSRSTEYIDLFENDSKKGKVTVVSYIVTSIQGDSITVQLENDKDQYIIETRDNRVECSNRKSLKIYKQSERLAIYCNNIYYDCEVKYDISLEPGDPENEIDNSLPECSECTSKGNSCFESIFLPVHSWYYLYYDGYDSGMYLDFLISSHKKDTMRMEVQSKDGLFYLVSTRKDKSRCSEPQKAVPVRWKSARIAVYCYNNYIGCKFSLYVRSTPMDYDPKVKTIESEVRENKENEKNENSFSTPAFAKFLNNVDKIKGYTEPSIPKWSEWSEWSDCMEYKNGMGKRIRRRECLNIEFAFVLPENATQVSSKEFNQLIKSSAYPYCEGASIEEQNCLLDIDEHSIQNLIILLFIISAMILTLFVEANPRQNNSSLYDENVIKSNNLSNNPSHGRLQRDISISENSPLLNTYFRRYD